MCIHTLLDVACALSRQLVLCADCFQDNDCHYFSIYSNTVNTWPGPCVYDLNSADGTVQRDSDAALTAKLVTVATRADAWGAKCDSLSKGVNACKDCMAARAEQDYPDSHLQMCLKCDRKCRRCVRERKAAGAHRATVAGCFGGFTGIIRNQSTGQLNDMGQVLKAADVNCHDTCLDTWSENGRLRNATIDGKGRSR